MEYVNNSSKPNSIGIKSVRGKKKNHLLCSSQGSGTSQPRQSRNYFLQAGLRPPSCFCCFHSCKCHHDLMTLYHSSPESRGWACTESAKDTQLHRISSNPSFIRRATHQPFNLIRFSCPTCKRYRDCPRIIYKISETWTRHLTLHARNCIWNLKVSKDFRNIFPQIAQMRSLLPFNKAWISWTFF